MKPQTIRILDLWLGRPVCMFLSAARRIFSPFRRRSLDEQPIKKILMIKLIEQGATVLAYRAILRATEIVGRENVYFWVFEKNREILDLLDLIPPENVFTVRDSGLFTFALDILSTLRKIRRLRIDATVDVELFARAPAILAYLTRATRRAGLHRFTSEGPYRGSLLTHRIQHNPYLHAAMAYYLLVDALRFDPTAVPMLKVHRPTLDLRPSPFRPAPQEVAAVRTLIAQAAPQPIQRPLVLLNPNASDLLPLRRWPTERFIELGKRILRDNPGATIAITGAPSESQAAQEIAAAISPDRAFSLAGLTTLRQLVVLYTIADLLVTNDSGPGHYASLTPLPTLVLFGPETPELYGPLGHASQAITANLACSPCVSALNHRFSPCTNNVCMQRISVDEVYDRAASMLGQTRTPRSPVEVTVHISPQPSPRPLAPELL